MYDRDQEDRWQPARAQRRRSAGRGSWAELSVFFLIAAGVYLIAVLFDSAWTGQSGRRVGEYLRTVWGGATLVPLLFWLYLCLARLVRSRVPRPLGQILGTAQLYLSLAFLLGLARHVGWNPGWTIAEPGEVGAALARFFVLNLGVLGTVAAAAASFLLSAFLFGSRIFTLFLSSVRADEDEAQMQDELPRDRRAPFAPSSRQDFAPTRPRERPASGKRPPRGVPVFVEEVWESTPQTQTQPFTPPAQAQPVPEGPFWWQQPQAPDAPPAQPPLIQAPFVQTPPVQMQAPQMQPGWPPEVMAQVPADWVVAAAPEPAVEEPVFQEPAVQEPEPEPETPAPGASAPASEEPEPLEAAPHEAMPPRSPVDIIDGILASLESGVFTAPERLLRPLEDAAVTRGTEPRRPPQEAPDMTPPVGATYGGGQDTAVQAPMPEVVFAVEPEEPAPRSLEGVFPPPLDLFGPPSEDEGDREAMEAAEKQGQVIVETLANFGVNASVAHIVIGPSVVQFQIELAPGTKVNKVSGLASDLTMALAVVSVRVEAPILGQHYVGIEIPNSKRRGIPLRSAMESPEFQECGALLPLPMGMQVDSRFLVCGLEDMPHLLVAGTTGSGKSVFVNACILGMCSRRAPEELKLILVDPKHVEFAIYEGLPHLLARPISDPRKAIDALTWAVQEMENRTESFARARVRNLASFNEKVLPKDRYPNIVVVVDELADLMYTAGKEVEGLIARLAQKARAAGIHLILATQRPSVDVITGLIKANVPARVAFAVPSQTDSRTIIDAAGADKLLGKGDMLFLSARYPRPLRLQSPFITEERTLDFVEHMKNAFGEPEYIEFAETGSSAGSSPSGEGGRGGGSAIDDPKMEEAIRAVMEMGITSASGLQRMLSIGYPKAGRLVAAMEQLGILGPQLPNSTRPRDILMDEESAFEALERALGGAVR